MAVPIVQLYYIVFWYLGREGQGTEEGGGERKRGRGEGGTGNEVLTFHVAQLV